MSESNGSTKLLSRDAILSCVDYRTRDVPVPEWGGSVRVRGLFGHERDEIDELQAKAKGDIAALRGIREKMIVYAAIDEENRPLFKSEDVGILAGKLATALDRLLAPILEISGMNKGAIEEAEKNSETGPA
jgi:hypothetical protein